MNHPTTQTTQLVWGAALMIVGIAVFFRIPQVLPKLAEMGLSTVSMGFARACFYLMGIILIGGGARKIIQFVRARQSAAEENASGPDQP